MTGAVDPAADPAALPAAPVPGSAVPAAAPMLGPAAPPGPPAPAYLPAEPDRLTRFFTRLSARSPRWAAPLAVFACIGGAVGYTMWVDPTEGAADGSSTCLLKMTTGLDCPGCGGTRALWYVLHGDVGAAARHHIMFVFALPFLLYLYVAWAGQQLFRWRLPQLRLTPSVIGTFLAVWGVFSVLRNLPWAPFTWFYV
jgi:hypothetical protein